MAEHLAFFAGLGVVIVFLAALALGRLAVIGARDVAMVASSGAAGEETVPATVPASTAPADTDGERRTSMIRRLTSVRSADDGGEDA